MRLIFELRGGYAPTKANDSDAGFDLRSCENRRLMPGEIHTFDLKIGLQFDLQLPPGLTWYSRLAPKSGLADKYGVSVLAGVVDRGYTGNVKVVIARVGLMQDAMLATIPWDVRPGDKLCQIIPEIIADVRQVDQVELLSAIDGRGSDGFGSTGR